MLGVYILKEDKLPLRHLLISFGYGNDMHGLIKLTDFQLISRKQFVFHPICKAVSLIRLNWRKIIMHLKYYTETATILLWIKDWLL